MHEPAAGTTGDPCPAPGDVAVPSTADLGCAPSLPAAWRGSQRPSPGLQPPQVLIPSFPGPGSSSSQGWHRVQGLKPEVGAALGIPCPSAVF